VGGEDDRAGQLLEPVDDLQEAGPELRALLRREAGEDVDVDPPETARPAALMRTARGGSFVRPRTAAARSSIIAWSKRFSGGLSRVRTVRPPGSDSTRTTGWRSLMRGLYPRYGTR
jgi:hypothetical protein